MVASPSGSGRSSRVTILLLWLFTTQVQRAFNGEWILPLLGAIFLPYTTLSYILLYWWLGSVQGFSWFLIAVAFLVDVGTWFGGARSGTQYRAGANPA